VLDLIGTDFDAQNLNSGTGQLREWRQLESQPITPPAFCIGAGSTKPGAISTATNVTTTWGVAAARNWAMGAIVIRQSISTAAYVSVSGLITLTSNKSVSRAKVTLTDFNGETHTTQTNFFGYYRFADVRAGETYIMNVSSKRHSFSPQIVPVNEDMNELNFIAQP